MAKKQIVAHFNHALNKIIFYTIEDNKGEFTLLRRQGTEEYLIYDNKNNVYAAISKAHWKNCKKINAKDYRWKYDRVFFWADSAFVTKYGHPDYNLLIQTYKHLLHIKETDVKNKLNYDGMMKSLSIIGKIKIFFYYWTSIKHQQRVVRREVKGLKVIW